METERSDVNLQEMIKLQLAEVDMLQSMFANPGEFTLDSHTTLLELQAFVDGVITYDCVDSRIGFTIKISTSSMASYLELVCNLPHEYPGVLPVMFTRAPTLDRENHRCLREDLQKFLDRQVPGQLLICSTVEWLQENADNYIQKSPKLEEGSKVDCGSDIKQFTRLWIYSHHIYSKIKHRDIFDWALELGLHGFSMPGKPGIICVEGESCQVDDFWTRLRHLNWKRIVIKEQETMEVQGREISSLCRFSKFQELELDVHGGKGRSYHMDLGKFCDFLQEHESAYMFPVYFGVEGKSVVDSLD